MADRPDPVDSEEPQVARLEPASPRPETGGTDNSEVNLGHVGGLLAANAAAHSKTTDADTRARIGWGLFLLVAVMILGLITLAATKVLTIDEVGTLWGFFGVPVIGFLTYYFGRESGGHDNHGPR